MQSTYYRAPILLSPVVAVRLFSLACWCSAMGEEVACRPLISALDRLCRGRDSGRDDVPSNDIRDGLYGGEGASSMPATPPPFGYDFIGPASYAELCFLVSVGDRDCKRSFCCRGFPKPLGSC